MARDHGNGRSAARTLQIPLSANVPANLKRIELEIDVVGQQHKATYSAAANQTASWTWDGKDLLGRTVQGAQIATIRVGWVFPMVFATSRGVGTSAAGDAGSRG